MKKLFLPLIFICIFSGCSDNSDLKGYLDDAVANSNRAIEKIEKMHSYLAVSAFALKDKFEIPSDSQKDNFFRMIDGKLHSIVEKREAFDEVTKRGSFIEVTLPVVYYIKNTIVIHDVTNSVTSHVPNAKAIRIILY